MGSSVTRNYNRRDLIWDLTEEVSRGYASILGQMAGMQIRIDRRKANDEITAADYRAAKLRIEGVRIACETLYRLEFQGVLPGDLDARLKRDMKRWKKATEADEAEDRG